MKKGCLSGFLLVLVSLSAVKSAYSQLSLADSIDSAITAPYNSYFASKRESFYIQVNKQAFIPGELMAFKVYIVSAQTYLPFLETTNVYVDLVSENGTFISRQIIFAEGGSAIGTISLPASLAPGTYILRSYTAWSRNFSASYYGQQVITIAGRSKSLPSDHTFDQLAVGVYPEGGPAVSETETTFGVKVTDKNGCGKPVELRVLKNGRPVQKLVTNALGFGRFVWKPSVAEKLELEWTQPSGDVIRQMITEPVVKGIQLAVPFLPSDSLLTIELRTNPGTMKEVARQKFYLLFHRQGVVHKLHWASFINQRPVVRQHFQKKEFPEGVMHITLFDSLFKPVADRAVYIRQNNRPSLVIDASIAQDSGKISLQTYSDASAPVMADLSVSILPGGTRADKFSSSLLSKYLLEQDINGVVEEAHYYFESDDSVRQRHLDELLMVQGWRAYDWTAILNKQPPKPIFPFEQGFGVQGRIPEFALLKNKGAGQVIISSPTQELFLKTGIDSTGSFQFRQLFLQKGVHVSLFAVNASDAKRYKSITLRPQSVFFDSLPPRKAGLSLQRRSSQEDDNVLLIKENVLEEVKIKNRVDDTPPMPMGELFTPGDKVYVFNDRDRTRYQSLRDYLVTNHGVRVYETEEIIPGFRDLKRIIYRISFNFKTSIQLTNDPVLIIDGMQVSDLRIIESFSTRDIEAVAVNKHGSFAAAFAAGGAIIVKTRTSIPEPKEKESNQLKRLMLEGYSLPTSFFSQNYAMPPGSDLYNRYASVYWKPDVDTDSSGRVGFYFPVPRQLKNLIVIVEGIGKNGELFYQRKRVNL